METAVGASIPGVVGECGGSMACATCHVYVGDAWADSLSAITEMESAMLDCVAAERRLTSRLSCQIRLIDPLEGLVVQIPDSQY
jgi:2Fe-2S ferredoxin